MIEANVIHASYIKLGKALHVPGLIVHLSTNETTATKENRAFNRSVRKRLMSPMQLPRYLELNYMRHTGHIIRMQFYICNTTNLYSPNINYDLNNSHVCINSQNDSCKKKFISLCRNIGSGSPRRNFFAYFC